MKVIFSFIENRSGHVHSHLYLHVAFPCGSCATLPHLVPSVKNDCFCTLQFLHNHSTNPLPFLHIPPTPGHHDFDPLTSHKYFGFLSMRLVSYNPGIMSWCQWKGLCLMKVSWPSLQKTFKWPFVTCMNYDSS